MFKIASVFLTQAQRQQRWGSLSLVTMPMLGAYIYNLGYQLPYTCPVRYLTGIPCPTCGMTRSFMAIARGNWNQAITHHLFGPALFLLFLVVTVHIGLELAIGRQIQTFCGQLIRDRKVQIVSVASYLAYYLLRLYSWHQQHQLVTTFW